MSHAPDLAQPFSRKKLKPKSLAAFTRVRGDNVLHENTFVPEAGHALKKTQHVSDMLRQPILNDPLVLPERQVDAKLSLLLRHCFNGLGRQPNHPNESNVLR